jgi:CBS domain-containing protein
MKHKKSGGGRRAGARRSEGRAHQSTSKLRSRSSSAATLDEVKVREIMTRDVVTVVPEDRVEVAARRMAQYDCGAIPVVERDGTLVGMITDRDIVLRVVALGIDPETCLVGECMTTETVACSEERRISECIDLMARFQIRRLPVVNHLGIVVGVLSQSDLARFAHDHAGNGSRREVAELVAEVSEPAFTMVC